MKIFMNNYCKAPSIVRHLSVLILLSLQCFIAAAQMSISGTVLDENNSPLEGAGVTVAGTTNGTITDVNGKFTLRVSPNDKIQISFIGYISQTLLVGDKTNFTIKLSPDQQMLDELVIVGYGVQKKINLTGSVATVNFEKEMMSRPVDNASTALAGLAPGVVVQQSSGQPGSNSATIRIRGLGTLNSNGPLVLVDGIEWDMNNVNPSDIASISILKDAASTAIYGSRAANGVILVTTKKGSGKTKIDYSFIGSYEVPQNKLKLVSDYARFMRLVNEGSDNLGEKHSYSDGVIELWENAKKDPDGLNEYGVKNSIAYPNTDWFEELMSPGFTQRHNISVSGKSGIANYYMSFGYENAEGIMNSKGMDSGLERFQLRANFEVEATKWLSVGLRLNGLKQSKGMSDISRCFEYLDKTVPGVYPGTTNKWGQSGNPEESTNANNLFEKETRAGYDKMFRGSFTLFGKVKLYKGLTAEASYNWSPDFGDYALWSVPNALFNYTNNTYVTESALENGSITNNSFNRDRKNSEILLRYNTKIAGDHEISALAGFTTSYYMEKKFATTRKGMTDWNLHEISTGIETQSDSGSKTDWALISYFGRLNYYYKDRYMFEGNVRYDGSSRFSPDSRWGLFPSFSLGWRIDQENFMDFASSYLSNLKLRLSWGKIGNNASGNYAWQSNYALRKAVIDGSPAAGVVIAKIGNDKLKWETTKTTNIGLDFGFFDNKLSGEIDLYDKKTSGILYTPQIKLTMGTVAGATENLASVDNKGIEISLGWQQDISGFYYSVRGNFSYNHNKVVKYKGKFDKHWEYDEAGNKVSYYNNYGDAVTGGFGGVITEGHRLGETYYRKVYHGTGTYNAGDELDVNAGPKDGMIRTESDMQWVIAMMNAGYSFNGIKSVSKNTLWYGDLIYADSNEDGNYGNADDCDLTGWSYTPSYNFGLNLSAAYKGFDFYMLWAGCAGFKIYWNHSTYNGTNVRVGYGIGKKVADDHYFFDPENPSDERTNINGKYPRLTYNTQRDNALASDFWYYKGDYIKLKNIQVGYTLPAKLTQHVKVEKVRIYLSGENLLTITSYPGLDPEKLSSISYPLTRQFAIGAQITF